MRCFLILPLILPLLPSGLQGQLTRAVEVRSLPYERALEELPVALTATVGFVEGTGTLFVQDETAGTHLHVKPAQTGLRVGDQVRVEGTTMPGLYLPGVTVTRLEVLGHGPPPTPMAATYEDLASGRYHYQLVVVEGIGRRLTQVDENRALLHVMLGGRIVEVRVDAPPGTAPEVVDARLRITALAAGGINDRRQLVFPYLRATGWEDMVVTERGRDLTQLFPVPVASLLRFGSPNEASRRVLVRGVVLAAFGDGRVFIRDRHQPEEDAEAAEEAGFVFRALRIQSVNPVTLAPGSRISAFGFPVMDGFSATLADAQISIGREAGVEVKPVEVTAAALADGAYDADLVTLSARLVNGVRMDEFYELRLEAGELNLRAIVPVAAPMPELVEGSLLRLTGICQVESSSDKGFRSRADSAVLLLRGPADLQVLQAPPWWTARRLAVALGILGGTFVLGLVWIGLLRRQVTRQAAALSAGVAHKAALEERQRIAREFHDTLEQELAGLNLRLDAALTRPLEEKARGLLDASRQLVKRVQAEARNLVADLRADPAATADLGGALRDLAEHVSLNDIMAVQVEIEGNIPLLPAHAVHHLRMIAQEAVTNALKHAEARIITLGLSVRDGVLRLTIGDDGRGLEESQTQGKPGHFGCMGIRERARKIAAEVEWKSREGGGTLVEVQCKVAAA